ncbi:ABC transporter permease [Paucisalibacillus sp. EB02]|uniref:ABC transporter permease n=1 Tax=Paucisalibacillus sp. EB02 TaxID=1347087 RepID=UPI0005AB8C0A|nr:ABC transporter permease [Paucisalibacillus sp. EB02]
MGSFLKKDLLVFWRDRKEVLIALLLPIILIVVLNVALSGLFTDDGESMDIQVGIVEEDNSLEGLERFEEAVNEMDLDQAEKEAILQQTSVFNPSEMIISFFDNPEIKQVIHTKNVSEAEAVELVEEGDLHAFVRIPEGFTYAILSSIMLDEEADVALSIQAEEQSNELNTLQNMMNNFIESINLELALGTIAEGEAQEPLLPQGGREVIEGVETYSFTQYITIAMSTLFALFMAQTLAMKTVTEKRERVFNRIILTGSHPFHYLMGKTLATFILSWLQIIITFTISQLLFDVFPDKSLEFWIGLLIVITAFALTISGLTALFTSITLNLQDTNAASGIFSLIIMSMAVLGGNFTPIQILPAFLQRIGEWTPNGLSLTVILEWIQLNNSGNLVIPMGILFGYFIVFLMLGMAIFPGRGRN